MSKTPPNRSGITFEVGAQLEARDNLKNWYAAHIEKIDYEDERVLIHYRQWSHRYDEWFDWASPYLRPVERVQLRREGRQDVPGYRVNEKVLASWSDCRFYPAKILTVNRDTSYTVRFYDGIVQTVKRIHVKPFVKERKGGKSREYKDGEALENGFGCREGSGDVRNRQERNSMSDQDGEHFSEEESDVDEDYCQSHQGDATGTMKNKRAKPKEKEQIMIKTNLPEMASAEMEVGRMMKAEFLQETEEKASPCDDEEVLSQGGVVEDLQMEGHHQYRRRQCAGSSSDREQRKREGSVEKTAPSKKNKLDVAADTSCPSDLQLSGDPTGESSVIPSSCKEELGGAEQTEGRRLIGETGQTCPLRAPMKRQASNPNRFSREPLCRVIKNQPPLNLSISLDHNPYKCHVPDCLKSFRKAKLLHYHMKYYHSVEQAVDEELALHTSVSDEEASLERPKKGRTISSMRQSRTARVKLANRRRPSASRAQKLHLLSLREKTKENHLKLSEVFALETALAKEKEKLRETKLLDFLWLKSIKKKNRRSKSDEDSESCSSSISLGSSEDESGMELDVTTPPEEADDSGEIVRCICKVEEENDCMVQCEKCLCWQHSACMGLLGALVPDKYTCYICSEPQGRRQSQRFWCDQDWLHSGHMYGLSFLQDNYSQQNGRRITATHQLLGDVQHVLEVLNGLQLNINILQSQTSPDRQWQHQTSPMAEKVRKGGGATDVVTPSPTVDEEEKVSYIHREHCYQKPCAYYPVAERRLVVETRDERLGHILQASEELVGRSASFPYTKQHSGPPQKEHTAKTEPSRGGVNGMVGGACLPQQWQVNLLDHIEAVQEEVAHRMDCIERQLDVLEKWLDYTGELEPPDPLARLPQLKQHIKLLLAQLAKVQEIALCCTKRGRC